MRILVATESDTIAAEMLQSLGSLGCRADAVLRERNLITRLRDCIADMLLIDVNFGGEGEGESSAQVVRETLGIPVVCMVSGCDPRRRRHRQGMYYMPVPADAAALRFVMSLHGPSLTDPPVPIAESEHMAPRRVEPGAAEECSIETDPAGLVLRMNAAACRVTGWPAEEALGTPVAQIFRTTAGADERSILLSRDGSATAIVGSAAPLFDGSGAFAGIAMRFRIAERTGRPAAPLPFPNAPTEALRWAC